MGQIVLSDTGTVLHPSGCVAIEDAVRLLARKGHARIRVDLNQAAIPNSRILVVLTRAARKASELGVSVGLVNASQRMWVAITQLGIAALGISLIDHGQPALATASARA